MGTMLCVPRLGGGGEEQVSAATPGSSFGGVVISLVEQRWRSSTREIMTKVSGATLGSLGEGQGGEDVKVKKKLHREESGK